MRRPILLFCLAVMTLTASAQIQSPSEFLGYELGTRFTHHQKIVEYFKSVAANSKLAKLQPYGKTNEGRELLTVVVSDAANIENLAQIKERNLALTNGSTMVKTGQQPAILWLSYNVHGNEANSSETAMQVLYTLANAKGDVSNWLKNTVVIIDPCLNPDGRERYVNFFNSVVGKLPNPDPSAREHQEPWPGGRSNHYYFDLNRDWAWQTQIESEQRVKLYHQWLPQIHVDFHEQGYNEPYYFAPAAEPVHQSVTAWQREFQVIVGKNNAKYFDENGWQYFTKERFDLLYPSYGDTYPLYNGAIGMTYEQGGIRAGLAVVTADGDTLTLKDRIAHHFSTSMSTLEAASQHSQKLLTEFKKFFDQSLSPKTLYKSYVIKGQNIPRLRKLADLLTKNNISFAFGGDRSLSGYSYETLKTQTFKLERNDMVISVAQKHGVMANILFEPNTFVTDSNTYDITAWALPYAYGLPAFAVKDALSGAFTFIEEVRKGENTVVKPYAWVLPWGSLEDVKLLNSLFAKGVKVRVAEEGFTIGGINYKPGSILIYRVENEKKQPDFSSFLQKQFKDSGASFKAIASGFVEKGKDFGSSTYRLLTPPKIAVVAGQEVSSLAMGEVWAFFESELGYPISVVNVPSVQYLDINKTNVLIVPDGSYSDRFAEQLLPWVNAGGKLILLEDAITAFVGKKSFAIKLKEAPKEEKAKETVYVTRDSEDFSNSIPGAIYKVQLDPKSTFAYGIGTSYYTLKTDDKIYQSIEGGGNIGYLKKDSYIAGLAGQKVRQKLTDGILYGKQNIGKGEVVYLATDPLFRLFWENGKQLFVNAIFF